ncbi:hypothetical protein ACFVS2_21320 [Brevibacillus sp. NPDC058079]|uniref:hypothetical protein n=1 Tax=Brevibacillus sp. NPDC058079 TaxID=3346330 RepID=UPI0036E17CBF
MTTNNHQEVEYVLGQAPNHIEQTDILPYFVYAYELSWTLPMFIDKKDRMISYLQTEVENESIDIDKLSNEKRWWLYSLITMREIAKYHEVEFAQQTIQHVISRIQFIPQDYLLRYANIIQYVMLRELPDVLVIRPLEFQAVKSEIANTDESVQFILGKKDALIKVIKKHLIQRDLQKEYFDGMLMKDRSIMRKFSNMWNAYFEVFMHSFIATYDYSLSPENMNVEELDKAISDIVLIFLVTSIENKEKIDDLHVELYEIMKDIAELSRN